MKKKYYSFSATNVHTHQNTFVVTLNQCNQYCTAIKCTSAKIKMDVTSNATFNKPLNSPTWLNELETGLKQGPPTFDFVLRCRLKIILVE